MIPYPLKKRSLPVLILIVIVAFAPITPGMAAERKKPGIPNGPSGNNSIQGRLNAIETKIDSIQTTLDAIDGRLGGLKVTVLVNEGFCGEDAAVQCGDYGTGHTFEAASSSNHNPVHILALVTRRDGSGVDSIPSENFHFWAAVGPGPGIYRCGDPQDQVGCGGPYTYGNFSEMGNGFYAFVVHPSVPGYNWKVAKYGFLLTVNDNGGNTGEAIGQISINK